MGNGCMRGKAVEVTSPTLPAFKVVIVGDSGSGKTSIIRRFVENRFEAEYLRTADVDITSVVKKLNVPEHAIVTVELWDVPGQNDVDLRKTYYLDVDAVIVVVDISRDDSLNIAGSWSLDVSNHARVSRTFTESVPDPDGKTYAKKIRKEYLRPKPGTIPILLLGNKYDLAKKRFVKELEEAEAQEVTDNTSEAVGEVGESPTPAQPQDGVIEPKNEPDSTKSDENQSSKSVPDSLKTDHESAKSGHESAQRNDDSAPSQKQKDPVESVDVVQNTESGETTSPNGVPAMNGHVGNGDLPNGDDLKKVHPKNEKTLDDRVQEESDHGQEKSLPEDAKSAVTMAMSAMSVLPPCVEEIEKIAEKYGFVAGIPVSAKTRIGGVQEAIQSILRCLVAKKLFNLDAKESVLGRRNGNSDLASTKSAKSSRSKVSAKTRKKDATSFEALQEVGIIEIDEVIKRCNDPLREAEDMTTGYLEALRGFKTACYKNGITPEMRVTLEACIASLKQAVSLNFEPGTSDPRENVKLMLMTPEKQAEKQKAALTLTVEGSDGFPDLRIINDKQQDVEKLNETILRQEEKIVIQQPIQGVLEEYREKLLPRYTMVAKRGKAVEAVLDKCTKELASKEEKAWETSVAAGLSPDEVRRILSTIAQDKARLRGTAELIRETRKTVQSAAGKIKASVLF